MEFIYNDGGRAAAGYKGNAGDCVVRAICIATGMPYQQVYDDLLAIANKSRVKSARRPPNRGVDKCVYHNYIIGLGATWVPTMFVGSGCNVHLEKDELPSGRIICNVSKHLTAVINGVIHDTNSPYRAKRCVYGYYVFPLKNIDL